ncbi:MAG: hypothetical protein ACK5YS_04340 [bacterium]
MKQILFIFCFFSFGLHYNSSAQNPKDETFTIENYYKVKWGFAEEFLSLYKKNHYPLLKRHRKRAILSPFKSRSPGNMLQKKADGTTG